MSEYQFEQDVSGNLEVFKKFGYEGMTMKEEGALGLLTINRKCEQYSLKIHILADKAAGLAELSACFPEKISLEKMPEVLLVVNEYNRGRMLGNLEVDLKKGIIWYKMKVVMAGCRYDHITVRKMLDAACECILRLNRCFRSLEKGEATLKQLIQIAQF